MGSEQKVKSLINLNLFPVAEYTDVGPEVLPGVRHEHDKHVVQSSDQ